MEVLARCKCKGFVIDTSKARECIEEMNKNTVSKEFLKECEETAKLFEEDDNDRSKNFWDQVKEVPKIFKDKRKKRKACINMEDFNFKKFQSEYEYESVKEYVKQGIISFKKLKEKGLKNYTAYLNEDNGSIVLLDGNIFSVKLYDDKEEWKINSCIFDVYKDEKGNFYTRIAKETDDPNFNNKFLYDALLNHCAINLSEVIH